MAKNPILSVGDGYIVAPDPVLLITLRDLFAAAALVGLLAQDSWIGLDPADSLDCNAGNFPLAANRAYSLADAMLAERDKP